MVARIDDSQELRAIAMYRDEATPVRVIAETLGITRKTVFNILQRHGVPRRRRPGSKRKPFTSPELDRLRDLRSKSWSKEELLDEFNCGYERLNRELDALGFPQRMRRRDTKERHINTAGYALVWLPSDDPFAEMVMPSTQNRYVKEHRIVMARHLGRPLTKSETVHHINGVRDDNRIENLQLRSGNHGKGTVLRCLDCGSHNVGAMPLP